MDGSCFIIGAGFFGGFQKKPSENDYVIAADGGYRVCVEENVVPDLVVGDFDSLGAAPDFPNVIRMPVEKDDTDTLHAIRLGLEKGYLNFEIYGGTGGKRADHTIANLQSLLYLSKNGAHGTLYGDGCAYTVIRNETLRFDSEMAGDFSVFCMDGTAYGVTLKGLKYSLDNYTMTSYFPIGVSNSFTGREAEVTVKDGILILYYETGKKQCI